MGYIMEKWSSMIRRLVAPHTFSKLVCVEIFLGPILKLGDQPNKHIKTAHLILARRILHRANGFWNYGDMWGYHVEMFWQWDTSKTGWWFGTFIIFPYIGNSHPN